MTPPVATELSRAAQDNPARPPLHRTGPCARLRRPRRRPNRPRSAGRALFRPGRTFRRTAQRRRIPAVIPIVRAPDDPGIDEEGARDEFAEQIGPPKAQAGGWRGFLSRWGG